jgi:hypothetical protein
MALSNQTIQSLSDALVPEVVHYIFNDERWINFLHEVVPDAIITTLGQVDDDVLFDLSLCVMDSLAVQKLSNDFFSH